MRGRSPEWIAPLVVPILRRHAPYRMILRRHPILRHCALTARRSIHATPPASPLLHCPHRTLGHATPPCCLESDDTVHEKGTKGGNAEMLCIDTTTHRKRRQPTRTRAGTSVDIQDDSDSDLGLYSNVDEP